MFLQFPCQCHQLLFLLVKVFKFQLQVEKPRRLQSIWVKRRVIVYVPIGQCSTIQRYRHLIRILRGWTLVIFLMTRGNIVSFGMENSPESILRLFQIGLRWWTEIRCLHLSIWVLSWSRLLIISLNLRRPNCWWICFWSQKNLWLIAIIGWNIRHLFFVYSQ